MFQAIGRGVQKNANNTITVKVEFLRDVENGTQQQVRVEAITADTLVDLRKQVVVALKSMKAAEQDIALNDAIVGVILGEI